MIVVFAGLFGYKEYKKTEIAKTEKEYRDFLVTYEGQVVDLSKEASLAYYTAITSGRDEDYAKSTELNLKLNEIYLNRDTFQKLKTWKNSGLIKDPLLKRQLDIQYISFISSLSDKEKINELTKMQSDLEQKFNTFRVKYKGKEITDNDVENILKTSKNSTELKRVWEDSKKIGDLVSSDVVKMAKMRNEIAKDLGFSDHQKMALTLNEQDPEEMDKLFDELDLATKDIYAEAKGEIDEALAKRYGIKVSELQPWHYQNRYFQEVPSIFDVDLDSLYANKDVLELAKNYYRNLGLPIDEMVENSDLYERPGKYQHAICFDMDRKGDIRVVANITNKSYWMDTLLHEYGHALYFKKIDPQLPWELRNPAHTFTTEAVANFFQDMVYTSEWMTSDLKMDEKKVAAISSEARENSRLNALIFSRWAQVMYRFEKSMYENPDQDLNQLWWDLVEKYQLVKKPERRNAPDWASKIHVISTPIYYHNYLLGYLYASQLRHYINTNIVKTSEKYPSYSENKEVGKYLTEKVFAPGAKYGWQELIEKSTGEKLNPDYFAKEMKK